MCIDRDDDGLRAEPSGELAQQLGSLERSAVHEILSAPASSRAARVGDRAYAASDGERDRETIGNPRDELDERIAPVERRLDVEVDELVRARVGVQRTELDRVADLGQALEAHALDDASGRDIEARDQARERHRSRRRAPAAPLFSGWNWTPRKLPASAIATTPSERAIAAGVSAAYECAK